MSPLTPRKMLQVWEEGQSAAPWVRAMLLLKAAEPSVSRQYLTLLPIGERDARLLDLRQAMFGDALKSLAVCPKCNEQLELNFSTADVRLPAPKGKGPWTYEDGPLSVTFKLPATADLEALTSHADAAETLLSACVCKVMKEGSKTSINVLSQAQRAALIETISDTDPRADMKAAMICPRCGHEWSAQFDILAFFWEEIGAWVRRLLTDVHVLARAYGWRERDVLNLSPWRRRQYLALARS